MKIERLYTSGNLNVEATRKFEATTFGAKAYKIRLDAWFHFEALDSPIVEIREVYSTTIVEGPKAIQFVGIEEFQKMGLNDESYAPTVALGNSTFENIFGHPFGRDTASKLRRSFLGNAGEEYTFGTIRYSAFGENLLIFLNTVAETGSSRDIKDGLLIVKRHDFTNVEKLKIRSWRG